MELKFLKSGLRWGHNKGRLVAYLIVDNWDDFNFKTLFTLIVFDEKGIKHEMGYVKIGFFGQEEGNHTQIPETFLQLDKKFFSLGQSGKYYDKLKDLHPTLRMNILKGLNDIVRDENLLKRALKEEVTGVSLLRDISLTTVTGQYKRLLVGDALLTKFDFKYVMPQTLKTAGLDLSFSVDPESNPPTNIHVVIGRNGVGKTHLLNNMAKSLVNFERTGTIETTSKFVVKPNTFENDNEFFAGVVSVAFSVFDPFEPLPEQKDKSKGVRYSYVGLKHIIDNESDGNIPLIYETLTNEFVRSLTTCISLGKIERWKQAIRCLESDPLLKDLDLCEIVAEKKANKLWNKITSLYNRTSSGHRIVLLTITKLVEKVEEKTLVLIDEPEAHLHPPLLSAFIRSLSVILEHRNGVAIIATHSPVVIQEVPRSCVWKLRRTGLEANAERPKIETFGENVSVLTREVFELEVTNSGFHKLLQDKLDDNDSYSEIVDKFDNNLGAEARAILRALIEEQKENGDLR